MAIQRIQMLQNIDKRLALAITGIVRGKAIKRDDILTMVKHTRKYFGYSEEPFQFITYIISSCDNKKLQQNQWTMLEVFFKSDEGQRIIKEVLNAVHISEEILDFFTMLIKANNLVKAMFLTCNWTKCRYFKKYSRGFERHGARQNEYNLSKYVVQRF